MLQGSSIFSCNLRSPQGHQRKWTGQLVITVTPEARKASDLGWQPLTKWKQMLTGPERAELEKKTAKEAKWSS